MFSHYELNAVVKPLIIPESIYRKKIQTKAIVLKRPGKLSRLPITSTKLNYNNFLALKHPKRKSKFYISEIVTINIASKPIVFKNPQTSTTKTSNILSINFEVTERSERPSNRLAQLFPENYSDIQQEINESVFDSDSVLKSSAGSNNKSNDSIQNKDSDREKVLENIGFEITPYEIPISRVKPQLIGLNEVDNPKKYNIVISCLDDANGMISLNDKLIKMKDFLQVSVKSPLDFENNAQRRHTQSLPKLSKVKKSPLICLNKNTSKFSTPSKLIQVSESNFISKSEKTKKLISGNTIKSQNLENKTKNFSSSLSLTNKVFKNIESSPYNFHWEKKILKCKIKQPNDKNTAKLPEVFHKKKIKFV